MVRSRPEASPPSSTRLWAPVSDPAPAEAQIDPTWDHQRVYLVQNPPSVSSSVRLHDRFTDVTAEATTLGWFSTPAQRTILDNGQTWPIHDARTHYMWWRINEDPIEA